ncbi:aminoacyl-tRNA hydrolase [Weissella diestrammenae]|uniref:Peptidyl-tRNA hydrolase n=1 Tax=Weissella diestrammenae TaxID=1162633 RepID=A0A7G9T7D7_9LACO|nr:aminoacyl-tRNA hydrolase [Weissella diestrammenae]MCM0582025.1 aminoacyl-tRNA hydrolase [Weissella diestrammenae]QNN76012.1 aminoacyl-tRNA hydrolase [Weissella diestrammenae]
MKMIVGLGNVGQKYDQTRHNIGFMVIDAFAQKHGVTFKQDGPHQAYVATLRIGAEKVLLVKPTTYMNLSGEAVGSLVKYYKLALDDLLIVQDDMDLALGKLRLREKGSAGGHNGIKSVIAHLGTSEFNRLKFGIAHPKHEKKAVVDFVLGKFDADDQIDILQGIDISEQLITDFCEGHTMATLMNQYN